MTHQPRLQLSIADKIDAFLALAALYHLRVSAIKLSPDEFKALHRDADARDYHEGCYAGIPLRVSNKFAAWGKPTIARTRPSGFFLGY